MQLVREEDGMGLARDQQSQRVSSTTHSTAVYK